MNSNLAVVPAAPGRAGAETGRLDYIDATRAFALLLGIVFHASLSFLPMFIGWAVQDVSTSRFVTWFFTVSHSFRMETFFLIAGFLSHLTFHRKGAASFVRSRALQILAPFVVGWFILHPLLVSGWTMGAASLRGSYSFLGGIREGFRTLSELPTGIFAQTHLWFLYYLALITGLTLVGRTALLTATGGGDRLRRLVDGGVAWLARSPVGLLALVAPMAAMLWGMNLWGVNTPDQTLQPDIGALAIYGTFFIFGWLLHRQPALLATFARVTANRVYLALAAITGVLWLAPFQMDPGNPYQELARTGFVVSYAFTMWSLVRLTVGAFHLVCRRPRRWVRYLADSSYWLYLVHLPIVIWLQVALAEVALPWWFKLPLVTWLTLVISIASYDLLVRSTFIGRILNGRRRERVLFVRGSAAPVPARQHRWSEFESPN